jgi:hypothetical protein
MKRRNFLKTLLAAPAIPLVGKAVEAEPVPEPSRLIVAEPLPPPYAIDPITVKGPFATTGFAGYTNVYQASREVVFKTKASPGLGSMVVANEDGTVSPIKSGDTPMGVVVQANDDGTCIVEMGHRFQAMVDHD